MQLTAARLQSNIGIRLPWRNLKQFSNCVQPSKRFEFSLLVAKTLRNGIGKNNTLPWKIGPDLKLFSKHTTNNVIVMGRKTYESFPRRPLPNRIHIVISNTLKNNWFDPNVIVVSDFDQALIIAKPYFFNEDKKIFVIGGSKVYSDALGHPNCKQLLVTQILNDIECDTHISNIPHDYKLDKIGLVQQENEIYYQFLEYQRKYLRKHEEYQYLIDIGNDKPDRTHKETLSTFGVQFNLQKSFGHAPRRFFQSEQILRAPSSGINPEEDQYLDIMYKILKEGNETNDRTNTGVRSMMGAKMVFNLRTGFPLITSKKMFWKGVVTELLWLLKGDTNVKHLAEQGNHIWDKDTSRKYLDERGMYHLEEGDCGATYGFNLRHYGAIYKSCNENYKGLGVDQLANCIQTLKTNPTDRRIILNLWNPTTLNNCSLPPCLFLFVLYVANGELSCCTMQRSGDLLLGIPWNVASSALLTHILANMTNLKVGDLHHNIVNAHIYNNHINGAKEQLLRPVHPKCQLQMPQAQVGENTFITRKLTLEDIDSGMLLWKDFKLVGYRREPTLSTKLIMAA